MLAMILTSPPHSLQVSMSISNTRFKRFAHVIEARFSAGVWSFRALTVFPLPRFAGVTSGKLEVCPHSNPGFPHKAQNR